MVGTQYFHTTSIKQLDPSLQRRQKNLAQVNLDIWLL